MEVTPNHYVIRVPRLAGYKTLFVNAVIAIWALVVAVWPELSGDSVTPEGVGAWFDQTTGLVVLAVAVINAVLRLMSSTPAAPGLVVLAVAVINAVLRPMSSTPASPFKRTPGDDGPSKREQDIYDEGYRTGLGEANRAALDKLARDLAAAGDIVLTQEPVDQVQVHSGPCVWPACACHIRCTDRDRMARPVAEVLADERHADPAGDLLTDAWPPLANVKADLVGNWCGHCGNTGCMKCNTNAAKLEELVAKPSFVHTLTTPQGMRAMLAGFLLPWFVLSVAVTAGCAVGPQEGRGRPEARSAPAWNCTDVDACVQALRREMGH